MEENSCLRTLPSSDRQHPSIVGAPARSLRGLNLPFEFQVLDELAAQLLEELQVARLLRDQFVDLGQGHGALLPDLEACQSVVAERGPPPEEEEAPQPCRML